MTDETTPARRRPILVWVIFLFYLVSSVQVIVAMFFVAAGGVDMAPEQQAYLAKFSTLDRVIGYVNAAVTLVGGDASVRFAPAGGQRAGAGFCAQSFFDDRGLDQDRSGGGDLGTGLLAQGLGIAIFGAVVYYAWRLEKRGIAGLGRVHKKRLRGGPGGDHPLPDPPQQGGTSASPWRIGVRWFPVEGVRGE